MMRGLVIATNGDMRVQTFTAPALEDVQKVVGGYVETVPVRNIEGHYLLMVDEDARLQWPRPVVNEVASFLACTKIFGTVVLTSAYGPELGLPDDIAHVLGDVIMARACPSRWKLLPRSGRKSSNRYAERMPRRNWQTIEQC